MLQHRELNGEGASREPDERGGGGGQNSEFQATKRMSAQLLPENLVLHPSIPGALLMATLPLDYLSVPTDLSELPFAVSDVG